MLQIIINNRIGSEDHYLSLNWGKFGPTCRTLQLHLHPLQQALLMEFMSARRVHYSHFRQRQQLLPQRTTVHPELAYYFAVKQVLQTNRALVIEHVLLSLYFLLVVIVVGKESFGHEET